MYINYILKNIIYVYDLYIIYIIAIEVKIFNNFQVNRTPDTQPMSGPAL